MCCTTCCTWTDQNTQSQGFWLRCNVAVIGRWLCVLVSLDRGCRGRFYGAAASQCSARNRRRRFGFTLAWHSERQEEDEDEDDEEAILSNETLQTTGAKKKPYIGKKEKKKKKGKIKMRVSLSSLRRRRFVVVRNVRQFCRLSANGILTLKGEL